MCLHVLLTARCTYQPCYLCLTTGTPGTNYVEHQARCVEPCTCLAYHYPTLTCVYIATRSGYQVSTTAPRRFACYTGPRSRYPVSRSRLGVVVFHWRRDFQQGLPHLPCTVSHLCYTSYLDLLYQTRVKAQKGLLSPLVYVLLSKPVPLAVSSPGRG